jgi:hypothetical protein
MTELMNLQVLDGVVAARVGNVLLQDVVVSKQGIPAWSLVEALTALTRQRLKYQKRLES